MLQATLQRAGVGGALLVQCALQAAQRDRVGTRGIRATDAQQVFRRLRKERDEREHGHATE